MKLLPAALLLLAALPATAQTPPIKPGLWTVEKMESTGDGAPSPAQRNQMADALKNMPPEQRAQMEAMMKQRGVDMSSMGATGGGISGMKLCYDRASLDQNSWQGEQGQCKTNFTTRTPTLWKWTSSCTQPPSTGEGEARFDGSDRYTVSFSNTTMAGGAPKTSRHVMTMRRLGDDCGSLKPIQSMKPPPK